MTLIHPLAKKIISYILISFFSLTMIFHILVLIRVIPYSIVWGGRLTNLEEMYRFEFVSLFLNSFFLAVVLAKAEIVKLPVPQKILNVVLWIMAVLFVLNTAGNLTAIDPLEKFLFTPVTFLLSILSGLLALQKGKEV